jgi:hypothetical protein
MPNNYLAWLHSSTRISVHPPLLSIPIDEEESDDEDPYDVMTCNHKEHHLRITW